MSLSLSFFWCAAWPCPPAVLSFLSFPPLAFLSRCPPFALFLSCFVLMLSSPSAGVQLGLAGEAYVRLLSSCCSLLVSLVKKSWPQCQAAPARPCRNLFIPVLLIFFYCLLVVLPQVFERSCCPFGVVRSKLVLLLFFCRVVFPPFHLETILWHPEGVASSERLVRYVSIDPAQLYLFWCQLLEFVCMGNGM